MSDPVSLPSWAIPVAREVVNNRTLIRRAFDEAINIARGRTSNVVFTGTFGAGKTVLRDHLVGTAFEQGYVPPPESDAVERGRVREVTDRRVRLAVVPGQESAPRLTAVRDLFLSEKPVDGFVHVVANGFVTLRSAAAGELVREQGLGTLQDYRNYQLG